MKVKKIVLFVLIILLVVGGVAVGMRWKSRESQEIQEEGIYVTDSKEVPFEYTKYEDHIVLEKYTGGEVEVTLPETIESLPVTKIGRECFKGQEQLERVVLQNNVESIGACSFQSCVNLKAITGGQNVICIDGCAFDACGKLEIVDLGEQIQVIDDVAFSGCSSLKNMPYQPNLTSVGSCAFFETALEEIPFGKEVSVQAYAFSDTPWLERQEEEFIIFGGGLVYYLGEDKTVVVPDGVEILIKGVFGEDTNVQKVYLPDSATGIQSRVFAGENDGKVYIPSSVTIFGDDESSKIYWDKKFTIVTTEGSSAQQYAKEHGLKCEIVDEIVYPK